MDIADDVDMATLAQQTEGFSGAELASLATEAGMFAIRGQRTEVRMEDFEDALAKVKEDEDAAGQPIAFA
jgi:proteasome regulatory subunit